MANILCARINSPFGWHYAWLPLNEDGQPNIKHESALKHPETIKIRLDAPNSSRNGTGQIREVSDDIILDQDIFGCEFAMIHTFPIFEKLIKSRLDENADEFVEQLYDLMGCCFQENLKPNGLRSYPRFLWTIGAQKPSLRLRETTSKRSPKLKILAIALSGSFAIMPSPPLWRSTIMSIDVMSGAVMLMVITSGRLLPCQLHRNGRSRYFLSSQMPINSSMTKNMIASSVTWIN